jgi:D-apionolactonase
VPDSSMQQLIRAQGFGPFVCAGHEFLRRLFVTVRDRDWQEIPPTQWECTADEAGRSILVNARHTSELVDLEWKGKLKFSADQRVLSFNVDAKAMRPMEVCRLGLVVLHPVDAMTGARITTHGPDGRQIENIPHQICPQPIIDGVPQAITEPFSSLTIDQAGLGRLELKFAGDLFELEDQRNWGDASFKTYCTPLRAGFPRWINEGSRVTHRVDASLFPAAAVHQRPIIDRPRSDPDMANQKAPKIGRIAPDSFDAIDDPRWMLGWDHIQVALHAVEAGDIECLLEQLPPGTSLHLELAIDDNTTMLSTIADVLTRHSDRISAMLVKDVKRPLPTVNAVTRLRQVLGGSSASTIPLLASPTGHFVEFNRNRSFDLDVDGIAFPLSPTVHSDDADTIFDNRHTVGDIVAAARILTGRTHIAISPLALYLTRARKPICTSNALVSQWRQAVIAQAAKAAVSSITFAADMADSAMADFT